MPYAVAPDAITSGFNDASTVCLGSSVYTCGKFKSVDVGKEVAKSFEANAKSSIIAAGVPQLAYDAACNLTAATFTLKGYTNSNGEPGLPAVLDDPANTCAPVINDSCEPCPTCWVWSVSKPGDPNYRPFDDAATCELARRNISTALSSIGQGESPHKVALHVGRWMGRMLGCGMQNEGCYRTSTGVASVPSLQDQGACCTVPCVPYQHAHICSHQRNFVGHSVQQEMCVCIPHAGAIATGFDDRSTGCEGDRVYICGAFSNRTAGQAVVKEFEWRFANTSSPGIDIGVPPSLFSNTCNDTGARFNLTGHSNVNGTVGKIASSGEVADICAPKLGVECIPPPPIEKFPFCK